MDNLIVWLRNLLYEDDELILKDAIREIDNPVALHIIAENYNWDDGFEVPKLIIENSFCDLGTALMIFYLADGYSFLSQEESYEEVSTSDWLSFKGYLFERISKLDFVNKNIQYVPDLTKVQIYKLKKLNPDIPDIFFYGTRGQKLDVVSL